MALTYDLSSLESYFSDSDGNPKSNSDKDSKSDSRDMKTIYLQKLSNINSEKELKSDILKFFTELDHLIYLIEVVVI